MKLISDIIDKINDDNSDYLVLYDIHYGKDAEISISNINDALNENIAFFSVDRNIDLKKLELKIIKIINEDRIDRLWKNSQIMMLLRKLTN